LEALEDRALPAVVYWNNLGGGDWADPHNWSSNPALPGPDDDVYLPDFILSGSGRVPITHTTGNDTVRSLHNYGGPPSGGLSYLRSELDLLGGSLAVGTASEITSFFNLSGATLAGPGDLTVDSQLTWAAGTMSGGGRTVAGGGLLVSGAGPKALNSRDLDNAAGATWAGTGVLTLSNATLNNRTGATFSFQNQATLTSSVAPAPPQFTNAGTVTVDTGGSVSLSGDYVQTAGTTSLGGGSLAALTFTNAGTVTIGSGLSLSASTSYTQTGGATVLNGGYLSVVRAYILSSPTASSAVFWRGPVLGPVNIQGGSLSGFGNVEAQVENAGLVSPGGATLTANTLTVSGPFDNSGTVVIGPGTTLAVYNYISYGYPPIVIDTPPVQLSGYTQTAGSTTLNGGTLSAIDVRTPPFYLTGSQPPFYYPANTRGLVNLSGGTLSGSGTIYGYLSNAANVRAGATAADALTVDGTLTNAGTVTVGPGSLTVGYSFTQTAGTTTLNGGHLTVVPYLVDPAGPYSASAIVLRGLLDVQGGTLAAAGTIDADVRNAGQIDVGGAGAAGLLAVTGNFTQAAAGTLNMELGGTQPGQYDQLQVGGSARLAGTLNVLLLAPFVPDANQFFQLIQSSSWQPDSLTIVGPPVDPSLVFVYFVSNNNLSVGFLPAP
jgi:hypothetical protein